MTKTSKQKTQPAKEKPALHVTGGGIRIPIWKNQSEDGVYYKAGIPELRYKGRDDQWHSGKSYGPRDLINLIKVAAQAHTQLLQLNRTEKPVRPDSDEVVSDEAA